MSNENNVHVQALDAIYKPALGKLDHEAKNNLIRGLVGILCFLPDWQEGLIQEAVHKALPFASSQKEIAFALAWTQEIADQANANFINRN